MEKITVTDIFNGKSLKIRAREYWDSKDDNERKSSGKKYNHLFNSEQITPWTNSFDLLTQKQKVIIIKGELIRTYDSLPNKDKTFIKKIFHLSEFSSKWYRLPSCDKNKLIKRLIYECND